MFSSKPVHRLAGFALVAAILAGCSSAGTTPSASAPAVTATTTASETPLASSAPGGYDATIAAMVPQEIAAKGKIVVAHDATYPPFESIGPDGTTIIGFDADISTAIGVVLGLEVEHTNVPFDAILAGIPAGRYDMALSSIGDNKKREETMDFVTYYWNGTAALVPIGNPKGLVADALCGAKVGTIRASLQSTIMLPKRAAACEAAGKPAPIDNTFQGGQEIQALKSGRIDAVLADAISLQSVAQDSDGAFEVAGPVTKNPNPGGVAFPKGSDLVEPVHAAIQKLMADGTYAQIVEKWAMQSVAIDESVVNGAIE